MEDMWLEGVGVASAKFKTVVTLYPREGAPEGWKWSFNVDFTIYGGVWHVFAHFDNADIVDEVVLTDEQYRRCMGFYKFSSNMPDIEEPTVVDAVGYIQALVRREWFDAFMEKYPNTKWTTLPFEVSQGGDHET